MRFLAGWQKTTTKKGRKEMETFLMWTLPAAGAAALYVSLTYEKGFSKTFRFMSFCLALWIVGKTTGMLVIGPRLVRWYMADVFFIPGFAGGILMLMRRGEHFWTRKRSVIVALLVSWLTAMMAELFQWVLADLAMRQGKDIPIGYDPVDAVIFTSVTAFFFLIVKKSSRSSAYLP